MYARALGEIDEIELFKGGITGGLTGFMGLRELPFSPRENSGKYFLERADKIALLP
jgi:hypothetical protein